MSRAPGRRAASLALLLALGAGACKDKKGGDEPVADQPDEPAAGADAAPSPGLVYFGVDREGVIELRGGELRTVLPVAGPVADIAVAGGEIYAVADAQIRRADGGEGEVVGVRTKPGIARRIAAGQGDRLWAVTGKGLWRREGGEWIADDAFPRPRTALDVVADRRGVVVAAARDTAFLRDGEHWREIGFPAPPPEPPEPDAGPGEEVGDTGEPGMDEEGAGPTRTWVRSLVLGADGHVYATTSVAIYRLAGTDWEEIAPEPVGALAVASDGSLVAAAESGAILWGKPGAIAERSMADLGLEATQLYAVATDGAGRVWLASDGGLVIAGPDGEVAARYGPGTLPALGGRVVAIRVVEPPGVLPAAPAPRTGAVAGQVVRDGAPVAGAAVELCATPDTLFRASPCGEAAHPYAGETGEDGRFVIEGVPAGRYGLAIRAEKDWVIDLTVDCCAELFSEDRVDLGRVRVAR